MVYIGIDPGKKGGFAILQDNGRVRAVKMPATPKDIYELCKRIENKYDNVVCVMEKVHSQPNNGVKQAFTFGKGIGYLEMALVVTNISHTFVTPQQWLKLYELRKNKRSNTEWKNLLKARAQALFPNVKVTLDVADALLIANYCRERHSKLNF